MKRLDPNDPVDYAIGFVLFVFGIPLAISAGVMALGLAVVLTGVLITGAMPLIFAELLFGSVSKRLDVDVNDADGE